MKRKERDGNEEERGLCRRRGPIAVDLKIARVTRLPATHHQDAREEESKFDSLPYDLKMAIVSRLDAKSVIKFRCVSKFWSSIIRSRGFIDSFFSKQQAQRFIVALGNGLSNEPEEKLTFFFSFEEPSSSSSSSSLVPNFEMAIPVGLSSIRESFASLHGFLTVGAGEIIMVPTTLSPKIQPFYIFYYNVKTQTLRRVRLLGIGDNKEFRRSYGFLKQRFCLVRIAPQHVHSIASL
ncbi:unnamed protein product [Eruca vesicaria subsp. sativa]|uniref:F-box domain-containing protein n=1 Tax=Eruca vesicaria subsp. sativa TaxID=29727 RepID=A0ABC8IV58_ERUVS|nr:unnamed protein product [Eruca vesicaria subsp. sativa]